DEDCPFAHPGRLLPPLCGHELLQEGAPRSAVVLIEPRDAAEDLERVTLVLRLAGQLVEALERLDLRRIEAIRGLEVRARRRLVLLRLADVRQPHLHEKPVATGVADGEELLLLAREVLLGVRELRGQEMRVHVLRVELESGLDLCGRLRSLARMEEGERERR